MKKNFSTRRLVTCAALIALAYVLNNFMPKIKMPYGGSITLCSMFFIYVASYLYGPKTGIFAAVCYGILDLLISPSVYHPLQVILDYPLAFGMLGVGGFACKGKYSLQKGYIAGVLGRLLMCMISGAVFFAEYAPAGKNPWIYSLEYNAGYMIPEAIITLVLISIPTVYKAINRFKEI